MCGRSRDLPQGSSAGQQESASDRASETKLWKQFGLFARIFAYIHFIMRKTYYDAVSVLDLNWTNCFLIFYARWVQNIFPAKHVSLASIIILIAVYFLKSTLFWYIFQFFWTTLHNLIIRISHIIIFRINYFFVSIAWYNILTIRLSLMNLKMKLSHDFYYQNFDDKKDKIRVEYILIMDILIQQ